MFLNFILIDVPEAFVILLVGMAVFNLSIRPVWKKAIGFSFLYGMTAFLLTYFKVPVDLKVITLLPVMGILTYWVIGTFSWITFLISASAFFLLISAEFVIILIFQLFSINLSQILENPFYLYAAVWSYLIVLLGVSYLLRRFQFDLRNLLPRVRPNRYLSLLILTGGIEFFLILFMSTQSYIANKNSIQMMYIEQIPFLSVMMLILFIIIIYLFRVYLNATIDRVETETETPYLQNIQDLVTAIRSIKHDAVNHYTAIDGLLKVGSYDLAADYVKQLLRETSNIVKAVEGVKSPAVSALLHSKMAICVAEHIAFTVQIETQKQFPFFKTYDLIKVLGNLLDNAITATLQEPEGNRYIRFYWGENSSELYLWIENSGPTIPPGKLEAIFDLGYTTKTSGEGGVGLAVVKKVIDGYGGKISAASNEGVTRMTISFPA